MWSPEKSGKRTVSPNGEKSLAALASVMLVPLPPKSHSAMTPCVGRPGLARNAVSAAVASETTRRPAAQIPAQGVDDRRAPVRGHGDGDVGDRACRR